MDYLKSFGDLTSLVGLELADKVPNDVIRQVVDFGNCLLKTAFAEMPVPEIVKSLDLFDRHGFGYRDELHGLLRLLLFDSVQYFGVSGLESHGMWCTRFGGCSLMESIIRAASS